MNSLEGSAEMRGAEAEGGVGVTILGEDVEMDGEEGIGKEGDTWRGGTMDAEATSGEGADGSDAGREEGGGPGMFEDGMAKLWARAIG